MLIQKGGYVYMLTNKFHTVLYTGVTSNLYQRISDHKNKIYSNSFTAKYNCSILVWYESFSQIAEAIVREKQIKSGSRKRKIELINLSNPRRINLWEKDLKYW